MLSQTITQHWYRDPADWWAYLLAPLTGLYRAAMAVRRIAYQIGLCKTHHLDVPVIVVGNLTVGGTGKTPCVIALANLLQQQGYRPGIVSRGYGVSFAGERVVTTASQVKTVGDEALMIVEKTSCPMVIGVNRVACAERVLADYDCNVIISDDGLQHYALGRDIELVLVDGQRRFGNQRCLPAGPLREPLSRLQSVDYVISSGVAEEGEYAMRIKPKALYAINAPEQQYELSDLRDRTVHAVAAIGNPDRFFASLRALGADVIPHAYSDHAWLKSSDIDFNDKHWVVMTEKDAVKCRKFVGAQHYALAVDAVLDDSFVQALSERLSSIAEN